MFSRTWILSCFILILTPFRGPFSESVGAGALEAQEISLQSDHLSGLRPRNIGPAVMSGRFVDIAVVEKDPKVFYAASATGGLWKTTNNGVTFTTLFTEEPVHSIGTVVVHQADTSIVWIGSGERANRQSTSWGDGVYKSTNGGLTWTNMGLGDSRHIARIVLHPTNPDIVYVAALGHLWGPNDERGLYKSTDGGESWDRILHVDEDTGVTDIAMDPENPEILYSATYQRRRRPYGFHGGGPGSALWKSVDGGESWTRLNDLAPGNGLPEGEVGRIGISIFRSDPRIVYVSVEQGLRYNASTAYEVRAGGIYRSDDKGESWTFKSDWNPRPMYASQILVDPSDDQRVYMVNAYSWSDDGGENFTVPRQTLHGDDRFVWVNPTDSRHVMKADDGGIGISYDRGVTWLYLTHLPVSQFYRVSYDYRHPYWVYGGLQDNGSWAGPSATYRSEGILNHDWMKWGGGDGFLNLVDSTDSRTLYVESQYLGLDRVDVETKQRQSIRPGDPTGAIGARRNWNTWGDLDAPDERLGNAMAPANWDGPFLISPHDNNTLYAGTNILWKSPDQGRNWTDLGDHTTGVDRRTLPIMGELSTAETLSLDDGIPYWPSLTAIAESPLEEGVLFTGTDDGNVQVSRDGGATWTEVSDRVPGLPEHTWINGLEASRFAQGRVYLTVNNYRNDDYENYLFVSEDYGESWADITSDLPADLALRTTREDPRNPEVLYLGSEFGLFYSMDRGEHWIEIESGLPTTPVNDVVIHPRDNDLIVGTHGRGVWILDNINALQELNADILDAPFHLFSIEAAEQIRYESEKGHNGNMIFRGTNPTAGAIIDFWLGEEGEELSLRILNDQGREVAEVRAPDAMGMNRAAWNLRHTEPGQNSTQPPRGPLVVPGTYTVRLEGNGMVSEQEVEVREDPRLDIDPQVRSQWTADLLALGALSRSVVDDAGIWGEILEEVAGDSEAPDGLRAAARDLMRQWNELRTRTRRLRGEVEGWVGPLTGQQSSQRAFYQEMLETLRRETEALRVLHGGSTPEGTS